MRIFRAVLWGLNRIEVMDILSNKAVLRIMPNGLYGKWRCAKRILPNGIISNGVEPKV